MGQFNCVLNAVDVRGCIAVWHRRCDKPDYSHTPTHTYVHTSALRCRIARDPCPPMYLAWPPRTCTHAFALPSPALSRGELLYCKSDMPVFLFRFSFDRSGFVVSLFLFFSLRLFLCFIFVHGARGWLVSAAAARVGIISLPGWFRTVVHGVFQPGSTPRLSGAPSETEPSMAPAASLSAARRWPCGSGR